jgi:hypothetical protein
VARKLAQLALADCPVGPKFAKSWRLLGRERECLAAAVALEAASHLIAERWTAESPFAAALLAPQSLLKWPATAAFALLGPQQPSLAVLQSHQARLDALLLCARCLLPVFWLSFQPFCAYLLQST